jgi:hypothetical protein
MVYRCQACYVGRIINIRFISQRLLGRCWACQTWFQFVPGGGMFAKLVAVPPPATLRKELQHDAQG